MEKGTLVIIVLNIQIGKLTFGLLISGSKSCVGKFLIFKRIGVYYYWMDTQDGTPWDGTENYGF